MSDVDSAPNAGASQGLVAQVGNGRDPITDPLVLPRLTSFRWYAALAVFLFHMDQSGHWKVLQIFNYGTTGVSFFFILSGFVLTWSTSQDLPAWVFYRRRFARIYPSYIVMFFVAVAITLLWPDINLNSSWLGGLTTPFLLQSWFPHVAYPGPPFDGPAWTLSCEAFFYAIFPFVRYWMKRLKPRHRDAVVIGLVILAVIGSSLLTHFGYFNIAYTNPVIRSVEFVFGMWLAMRLRDGWQLGVPVWAAVVLVVIASELARKFGTSIFSGHGNYVVLVPFGILLIAGALADLGGHRSVFTWPLSIYLGEISFAFYLVQVPVTTLLFEKTSWGHTWSGFSGLIPLLGMFTATLAAAIFLHHTVELPMQRVLRGPGRGSIATGDPAQVAQADDDRSRPVGQLVPLGKDSSHSHKNRAIQALTPTRSVRKLERHFKLPARSRESGRPAGRDVSVLDGDGNAGADCQ